MGSLQQSMAWKLLADFTSSIEWTAVGSVLLFFTLMTTLVIASDSSRRIIQQERAVLRYIRRLLLELSLIQTLSIKLFDLKLEPADFSSFDMWVELADELARIEVLKLPTESAMQGASDARAQLKWLAEIYECGKSANELDVEEASLRSSHDRTRYWISILEREIDDRNPNVFMRFVRQIGRGSPPKMPPTLLGSAIEEAENAKPTATAP